MNILILTTHLNTGGITSYILTLTQGLVQKGHHVYVASSAGDMVGELKALGGVFIELDILTKSEASPKVCKALVSLQKVIDDKQIDVIHSQTRVTQVLGTLLSRLKKIPHVATCHGFFKPRLFRRLFPCWGDATIAISPQVSEHLKKDLGVLKNIYLIFHGVKIKNTSVDVAWKRTKRKALGLKEGIIIGIVARLSDVKGVDILIRAMKDVADEDPQANLVIAGEGKEKNFLMQLVKELRIEKNVFFLPVAQCLDDILPLFDIFVMPSRQEGLGLSVIEAQAQGLPVVVSDVGGLKSLIKDGEAGLLVPAENPEALSATLLMTISNMEKAKKIGANAKAFAQENFSVGQMIEKTLKAYQSVLS